MEIKLTPNTDIVRVVHKDKRVQFYEATKSVSGYIRKCIKEGKQAVYVGKTDSNGKIIVEK